MISRYLELLNATLGLSLVILIFIIIRDFKKQFLSKNIRIQIVLTFMGLGIMVLSIKELYKYGPFEITPDPVISEVLETLYLFFIFAALFFLLRVKELFPGIKK